MLRESWSWWFLQFNRIPECTRFPSTSELVRLQLWPQWSRLRGDGAVTWYEIVYYGFVCAYRMWSTKQQHQAIDVLKCTPQKNEYCNIYLHTKVSIRLSVLSQSSTTVTALVQVICTGVVTTCVACWKIESCCLFKVKRSKFGMSIRLRGWYVCRQM